MFRIFIAVLLAASLMLAIPTAEAAQKRHQPKTIKVLPKAHHKVVHRGTFYFFSGGRFYKPNNGAYVTIVAPLGAIVPALPVGYVSFGIGSRRHFYFQGVYYQQVDNGYEVIEAPPEAAQGLNKVIVYPAGGQTTEQLDKDRYECHRWATDEADFDPTDSESDPILRADYNRALEACLEARNYVVK